MSATNLLRTIIISGWIISGLISIIVMVSIVCLAFMNKEIPQAISNYGGVIIGFFFGQFASFTKDALMPQAKKAEAALN